jgi:hypothetical protein
MRPIGHSDVRTGDDSTRHRLWRRGKLAEVRRSPADRDANNPETTDVGGPGVAVMMRVKLSPWRGQAPP